MPITREKHKAEVLEFLRRTFPRQNWDIALPPHGTGHESYFAQSGAGEYFIKLDVEPARYQILSGLGISPHLVAAGSLADGKKLVILEKINGYLPSSQDFLHRLDQFAAIIRQVHQNKALKHILPQKSSDSFRLAGLDALRQIEQRWKRLRHLVPERSVFVEKSIAELADRIDNLQGGGLAASHNDPCNGNWLISPVGNVYLLDYEAMSLDDPALDLGALLWWYYPPASRSEFLALAGYAGDATLTNRMNIRMAMHCLNIILPRDNSFDRFEASLFENALEDFRAVMAGEENPQAPWKLA